MVNIVTHRNLYTKDVTASLEYAESLKPYRTKEKMVFNLYWRVPKEFGRKQLLPIKSIIANHEEYNSDNYTINLWSNVDLSNHELLKPYSKHITHRIWNPLEELQGTPLHPYIDYFASVVGDDERCWLGGDFFRLVCLYKYGGFYIDMDVCVLRDMSPLWEYSFVYQWGDSGTSATHGDPTGGPTIPYKLYCNGAVMNLKPFTECSFKFLSLLLQIPPVPNTTCWGSQLYEFVDDDNLYRLPCAWFNTELCVGSCATTSTTFFKTNINSLYNGAFTWHWHNQWDAVIEQGSKFQMLESIIENKLSAVLAPLTLA